MGQGKWSREGRKWGEVQLKLTKSQPFAYLTHLLLFHVQSWCYLRPGESGRDLFDTYERLVPFLPNSTCVGPTCTAGWKNWPVHRTFLSLSLPWSALKCEYGEEGGFLHKIGHPELLIFYHCGSEFLPSCVMYTKRMLVIVLILCPLLFIFSPPSITISGDKQQCHLKDPISTPPSPHPNCSCPSAWRHGTGQHVVAFSFYGDPTSPHMVAGQNWFDCILRFLGSQRILAGSDT